LVGSSWAVQSPPIQVLEQVELADTRTLREVEFGQLQPDEIRTHRGFTIVHLVAHIQRLSRIENAGKVTISYDLTEAVVSGEISLSEVLMARDKRSAR
jgi:hypothetical protein